MILGTLIYYLFATMATAGTYFAARQLKGDRAAWIGAGVSLLFFVALYVVLDLVVLSQITDF